MAAGKLRDHLERGQGDEGDNGEHNPVECSAGDRADPDQQRGPHGDSREQRRQPLADAGGSRAGDGDARQPRLVCRRLLKLRLERSVRDQFGGALEEVDHSGRQLSPGRRLLGFRVLGQPAGQPRHRGGRQGQRRQQDQPRRGQDPPYERDDQCADDEHDGKRGDNSEQKILKRVDVVHDAGEQIAAAERREAGWGQRFEPSVGVHPQIGEGAECGVVTGQPPPVAEQGARQAEELDTDDGQGQGRLGGSLRRARDQPGGRGDQPNPCADGSGAEQGGERQPRGSRARELHRGPQRRARAGGLGRDDRIARPAHVAPTACGPSSTTRSARLTSAGRWATITAVRS